MVGEAPLAKVKRAGRPGASSSERQWVLLRVFNMSQWR